MQPLGMTGTHRETDPVFLASEAARIPTAMVGRHWLAWGIYQGQSPFSADAFPYGAAIDRNMTVIQYTQIAVVATTNDTDNYWLIYIFTKASTLVATVSTAGLTHDDWRNIVASSISYPNLTTADVMLYVYCQKIGNPGNLSIFSPALEVNIL